MKRLTKDDLPAGQPIAFDIYDEAGQIVIKNGFVLESAHQIDILLNQGIFAQDKQHVEEPLITLKKELEIHAHLSRIIRNNTAYPNLQKDYLDSASNILTAIEKNQNICLAFVFFNKGVINYPLRHSLDTAILATVLAKQLGHDTRDLPAIIAASLTMNLSMLKLQEELLARVEKLTEEQRTKIKNHPAASRKMLEQAGITETAWLDYVLCHHEKKDGSGYPRQLKDSAIPDGARLIGLADRYTAMVSPRLSRPGYLPGSVVKHLLLREGDTLDLPHVGALNQSIGIYPPGTIVRLRNGETGVVSDSDTFRTVKIFLDAEANPLPAVVTRKTDKGPLRIAEAVRLESDQIPFDLLTLMTEGE
jgi:HD-GYP domain-containing protein (c-di-GMP phosphodiesterase class II)